MYFVVGGAGNLEGIPDGGKIFIDEYPGNYPACSALQREPAQLMPAGGEGFYELGWARLEEPRLQWAARSAACASMQRACSVLQPLLSSLGLGGIQLEMFLELLFWKLL